MMWNDGYGMMGWGYGGWFMGIIFLIVIAAIGLAILFVLKNYRGGPAGETPLEILKKRYAKGEISKEDFERMKKDL